MSISASRNASFSVPACAAVARVRRKHFAGDLFRHFEGEPEAGGRLQEQPAPEIVGGELVEGEVAAHRGKGLGVLAQALGLEQLSRKSAARQIVAAAVDLPKPAFVLPGAAADVDMA